jgi:enoyl-CoA hydratase/carnithine racemase
VTKLDYDPIAGAHRLAAELSTKSPDALAAAKRLFNDSYHGSTRRTFARERLEQAFLLAARNTKAAREAAFTKADPAYGPRGR